MPSEVLTSAEAFGEEVARLSAPVPRDFTIHEAACDRWARREPARRALLDLSDGTARWWSYGELAERSRRLANVLRIRFGVARGDRVAIYLPQSADAAAAHLAVYRLGAIVVPLSVLYGADALKHRLDDGSPVAGVTDASGWEVLGAADLVDGRSWLVTGEQPPGNALGLENQLAAAATRVDPADIGPDDPAMLIYTSGTTGNPKGAVHAHRVVAAHQGPIELAHDGFAQPGDLFWSPADWAWAGGLVDGLLASLSAGVPVVAFRGRRFDPDEVHDLITRHRIRNTFLPPTALRMLLREMDAPLTTPLRSVMTGGEPVGSDLIERSQELLGAAPNTVYGQTEASCVLGSSARLLPTRSGALGQEYPHYRVQVRRPDGSRCDADEVGELVLDAGAPGVFLGYWQREAATAEKVRDDLLYTGDLVRRDADGYYWFVSRNDDVILSSGFRIGPAEIEECAEQVAGVAAAAAIGEPDPVRGEIVQLVVELVPGVRGGDELADTIRSTIRKRLAPYEVPRTVRYVDALPRTTTGKISRAQLRSALTSGGGHG